MKEETKRPIVPTAEEFDSLKTTVHQLALELEMHRRILQRIGWVHHTEAQRILKVSQLTTLKAWRDKGKLEMRQVGERTYEVSLFSIVTRLLEKGHTNAFIETQL